MNILFLNPQGNFDSSDSYWTEHPDFGGQLVYVKEIAIEMAKMGHHVDIVTRYLDDPDFPAFQGTYDTYEGVENLRIVRIKAGGDKFLAKEDLWEHIAEWVDNIIKYYQQEGISIDFATGHYGDGGLACAMLKDRMQVPYSFTGHSLGAQKFDKLYKEQKNLQVLEDRYHFSKRILAENTAIRFADIIFVSTSQEKDEQYTHPLYKEHTYGKHFIVAPPGVNTRTFAKYNGHNVDQEVAKKIEMSLSRDIDSARRSLPWVLLASRLDPKKNHVGLLKTYAHNKELQEQMNIVVSLRGVENAYQDYSNLKQNEQVIMHEMMDIIKKHQLGGKVTFLNILSQEELANTYRYFASKKGVFCLPALYEPFGLAPIEAMSTGLPAVVTKYGGPSEVLKEDDQRFGVLMDVHDEEDMKNSLLEVLEEYDYYQKMGVKRVLSKYTWEATAKTYLEEISKIKQPSKGVRIPKYFYSKKEEDLVRNVLIDYTKNARK